MDRNSLVSTLESDKWDEPEHPLRDSWNLYYSRRGKLSTHSQYPENLQFLAELKSLEEFLNHYHYLKPPSDCPVDRKLLLFRKDCQPVWQAWPRSGCFLMQYPTKKDGHMKMLDKQWHRLLFNIIGESVHESVIGVSMCKREKITLVEIWLRDLQSYKKVGEKLVDLIPDLSSDGLTLKRHSQSMKNNSTIKGSKIHLHNHND